MHVCMFLACMCVYHMCAWCLPRPAEGVACLGLALQIVVSHHVGARNQLGPLGE